MPTIFNAVNAIFLNFILQEKHSNLLILLATEQKFGHEQTSKATKKTPSQPKSTPNKNFYPYLKQ